MLGKVNLNNIKQIKENIKTALENKGVNMTGTSFQDYPSKIYEIEGESGELVLSLKNRTIEDLYLLEEIFSTLGHTTIAAKIESYILNNF